MRYHTFILIGWLCSAFVFGAMLTSQIINPTEIGAVALGTSGIVLGFYFMPWMVSALNRYDDNSSARTYFKDCSSR